jgi:hypothetical protein
MLYVFFWVIAMRSIMLLRQFASFHDTDKTPPNFSWTTILLVMTDMSTERHVFHSLASPWRVTTGVRKKQENGVMAK